MATAMKEKKTSMERDLAITFTVDKTPMEVFQAINNVQAWWGGITGPTNKVGAVFTHRYQDIHMSQQKVTKLIPGKKVVWRVLKSKLTHSADQTEWNGTYIVFDIEKKGTKTELRFTHMGLVPSCDCYGQCKGAWSDLIGNNLRKLILKTKPGKDFTTSITVNQTPLEVFEAVKNVKGWWDANVKGDSSKLGAQFRFRYMPYHDTLQKVTEFVPGKRLAWHVTKGQILFVTNKDEWTGTDILFDIKPKGGKTELTFTHKGLVPSLECYEACHGGWTFYIQNSLKGLITKGKGKPNRKKGE